MRHPSRLPRHALATALALTLIPAAGHAQGRSVLELLPTEGRLLSTGEANAGALSASDVLSMDNSFMEAWELEGRAGESLTIDLVSDDFDPVLYVTGPGLGETLFDDDSGGGCNARLTVDFLETGTFRVVATSLAQRETGRYSLMLSERPDPTPTYACGEADPAQLAALPTEGRVLTSDGVASGQLGALSPTVQEGRPAEAWTVNGSAGDNLSIIMEASSFDAYLYLVGPGLESVMTDDDGGGGLNARIDVRLPADGAYTVVASSITDRASGFYTLTLGEPLDLSALDTGGRSLEPGQTAEGFLGTADPVVRDGRHGQAWALVGVAGQRLDIELRSDDFDAYLYLAGPGLEEPLTDDDGAGDLDSRISVTLPSSGTYRVIASALDSRPSGAFTLSVVQR